LAGRLGADAERPCSLTAVNVTSSLTEKPLAGRLGADAERPCSLTAVNVTSSLTEKCRLRRLLVIPDFIESTLGHTGIPVFRLGLSASYRPGEATVKRALDEGVNYFFCYGFDTQAIRVLRELGADRREKVVIGTGAYNYIWAYQDLKRTLEKRLRQLRTDYIDVFHFLGVTKPKQFTPRVKDDLEVLRHDPRVRAVGVSCHHRQFAAELAAAGALDCLMARYNAAHRGAEVFPALDVHDVGLVSYTATRWRHLLRRSKKWPREKPIPTAAQCYRFVLSNPAVDVCLTAPANDKEFVANLAAARLGPLPEDEMQFMRDYGDCVHQTAGWFM
jgi:aryl-alcohol dehydrogenase-like predicted oxidoreductase